MRSAVVRISPLLLALAVSVPPGSILAAPAPAGLKVLVVVHLREPDFKVLKFGTFSGETRRIPMKDYDFKVAFTDELVNALADDARAEWTASAGQEGIDVRAVWDKRATAPAGLSADRLLLVDVTQYGAIVASLAADRFWLQLKARLTDKSGGKKFWEKTFNVRLDLPGTVAALEADNQKGLKEAVDKMVVEVCRRILSEIKNAKY